MVKYIPDMTQVVFEEVPECISLAYNLTNCQNRCVGCHSPFLRKDIGKELTIDIIKKDINENDGFANCILIMGEGNDIPGLLELAKKIKEEIPTHKLAVYSGREEVEDEYYKVFDYVKVGPYKAEFGPLNEKTTNQRLYKVEKNKKLDITSQFWKKL